MSELQTVEVRFKGERLASFIDQAGEGEPTMYTLYRTPERLYVVYIAEMGEGGLAWLEAGHLGEGLPLARIRALWPELTEGAGV